MRMLIVIIVVLIAGCAEMLPVEKKITIVPVTEATEEYIADYDPCVPPAGMRAPDWAKGRAFDVRVTGCL